MANSRERRERYSTFGSVVKSKFTSKWEIVLVLVIVSAGVVITTIAAIKAREKSDTNAKDENSDHSKSASTINNKSSDLTTKSNIKAKEVSFNNNQKAADQSLFELSSGKSQTEAVFVENKNRRLPNEDKNEEDYETISDRVDSRIMSNLEPITSESNNNERRIHVLHSHDGLPGYPGPKDISVADLFKSKAELTADGAGFLIDENSKDNAPLIVNSDSNSHSDESDEEEREKNHRLHNEELTKQLNAQMSTKFGEKQIETKVYPDEYSPLKSINQPEIHRNKVQQMLQVPLIDLNANQNNRRPQLIMASIDRQSHNIPIFEHIKPVNGLPLGVSIPRRVAFNQHSPTHRSQNIVTNSNGNNAIPKTQQQTQQSQQVSLPLSPVFISQFSGPLQLQRKKRTVESIEVKHSEPQSETENNTDNSTDNSSPDNLQTAAASDYFKFNNNEKESNSKKSIFNYDTYSSKERRTLSQPPNRSNRKHSAYSYYPTASSNIHQYGILGSGNFEIIRGGTFNNDEIASSDNNYIREQSNRYQSTDDYEDNANDEITKYPAPYSEEEDFFSNNPVLGFQGYDNFQAASGDKSRTASEHSHHLENSSQPSQQVPVYMDQDLMAIS